MRFSGLLAGATLLFLLLPTVLPPASAGSEPPNPFATAFNTQRKVARAADGKIYAAIVVDASGVPQVRVVSSTDGQTWITLPLPSLTGSASDRPSLAIDSGGQLHLVWTETTAGNRQVFYARLENARWTAPEQLSHSPGYAGFPSLAVDASDGARVVWYGYDGTFYQIYYAHLEGSTWIPERALTTESVDATNPAIALGPQGDVHVAWFRLTRNGTNNEVAYLRVEGENVTETRAVSDRGVDAIDPSLVVDSNGTVDIVWNALVGGVERIQHIARESTWSAVTTVSPPGPGALHPSLALDGRSRLTLVWEGLDGIIYLQTRDGVWSAPSALSGGGVNRYPSARWSQFHNPTCGANAMVDVLWTEDDMGVLRLGYGAITGSSPCPSPPAASGSWMYAVLAVAAATAVVLVWFRLRSSRKPPSGPQA